jgi:hypothetical protein
MNEIDVWRKQYNGFADFFLEKRGEAVIRNVFHTWNDGWVITNTYALWGDRSDPLSFLVITGISVEEAWKRGSEIKASIGVIALKL